MTVLSFTATSKGIQSTIRGTFSFCSFFVKRRTLLQLAVVYVGVYFYGIRVNTAGT